MGSLVSAGTIAAVERLQDERERPRQELHGEMIEPSTIGCGNTQCRVVEYLPHSNKAQDQRCPACYGKPS